MPTATTVDVSGGQRRGRAYDHQAGLARVYADARKAGLDDAGARAAVAIAQTEGGMGGAVGDTDQGAGSGGAFQLFFGPRGRTGQGNAYAAATGQSEARALAGLSADPHSANLWALGPEGYLGRAIRAGQRAGLTGAALATHAQETGQVSVSPERAGQNYQALFGANQPAGGQAMPTATRPATTTTTRTTSGGSTSLEGRTNLRDKYQTDLTKAETDLAAAEADAGQTEDTEKYLAAFNRLPGLRSRVNAARSQLNRAETDLVRAGGQSGDRTTTTTRVALAAQPQVDAGPTAAQADASERGWAGVETSRQNAATALMREQVAEGTLDFNTAKDFLDRVDKLPPAVKVGDKWYYAGMEPGGFYQQLGQKHGYTSTVVEVNSLDMAAILGKPEYNESVLGGPYARQLNQGGVLTGQAAKDARLAGVATEAATPAWTDQSPIAPGLSAETSTPGAPTFGAEPPSRPEAAAATGQMGRPVPVQPPYPGDVPATTPLKVPSFGAVQPAAQTPAMLTYTSNGQPPAPAPLADIPQPPTTGQYAIPPIVPPSNPIAPAMPTAGMRPFPPAAPTVEQAAPTSAAVPIGASAPGLDQAALMRAQRALALGDTGPGAASAAPAPIAGAAAAPSFGVGFKERMVQHLVQEQGKDPADAERIAAAYLAQQGGQ